MTQNLKQNEIWLANLNPTRGTEPGKTRPVLIIQNQALLDAGHPSTLIIPLSTTLISNAEPLRIRVKAQDSLEKDSDLLIDQMRAIDNKRLIKGPIAKLHPHLIAQVYQAIAAIITT